MRLAQLSPARLWKRAEAPQTVKLLMPGRRVDAEVVHLSVAEVAVHTTARLQVGDSVQMEIPNRGRHPGVVVMTARVTSRQLRRNMRLVGLRPTCLECDDGPRCLAEFVSQDLKQAVFDISALEQAPSGHCWYRLADS